MALRSNSSTDDAHAEGDNCVTNRNSGRKEIGKEAKDGKKVEGGGVEVFDNNDLEDDDDDIFALILPKSLGVRTAAGGGE